MKNIATIILIAMICGIAAAQDRQAPAGSSDSVDLHSEFIWAESPEGRIGGRTYFSAGEMNKPVLAVVLHGDLLPPDDTYHYGFARTLATQNPNIVAFGVLRPGYSDEQGNRSEGDSLHATGDNYTAEAIESVGFAIKHLQNRYDVSETVLIGHSGGAAIAALLIGHYPEIADASLLVACPCDLPAWREHMMDKRPNPVWQEPHQGLSPLDSASDVSRTSIVKLIVGNEDDVVLPQYSQDYATALREAGVESTVVIAPGLGHNILLHQRVISVANDLVKGIRYRAAIPDPPS